MTIRFRTIVALGTAYFVGYSRGAAKAEEIGEAIEYGLKEVGEGLKKLAVELGVEFKQTQEAAAHHRVLVEAVHEMDRNRSFNPRSDQEIADELEISVEEVQRILSVEDVEGSTTEITSEEKPFADDYRSKVVQPTAEEAAIVDDLGGQNAGYHKVTEMGESAPIGANGPTGEDAPS